MFVLQVLPKLRNAELANNYADTTQMPSLESNRNLQLSIWSLHWFSEETFFEIFLLKFVHSFLDAIASLGLIM